MVRDFSVLKELLTEHVHDHYDHGFIVHESDEDIIKLFSQFGYKIVIVPWYPTAECLASDIYRTLKEYLPNILFVRVHETPTSTASYSEA